MLLLLLLLLSYLQAVIGERPRIAGWQQSFTPVILGTMYGLDLPTIAIDLQQQVQRPACNPGTHKKH
jgi:hypothetical protein